MMSPSLWIVVFCVAAFAAAFNVKSFDPTVPLSHCMRFGPSNAFQFEWELSGEPKNLLQVRFTSDVQRGFSGVGFTRGKKLQLLSGWPIEQTGCARSLYDTHSPYDVDGNIFPNYPEVPATIANANASHATHYLIRNISTNAAKLFSQGSTMTTNVTLLWAYMQSSLFQGACYMGSVETSTEQAELNVVFGDSYYLYTNGECKTYTGEIKSHHGVAALGALKDPNEDFLEAEKHQNTRVATLLIGGDALLQTGRSDPEYNTASGFVKPGENGAGVCQDSLSTVRTVWGGFSDRVGGITEYQVTAGTRDRPSTYLDRVSAGTNLALTSAVTGTLTKNQTLYVSVTAFNFAGLTTTIAAKPIRVLNQGKPVFGEIFDGTVAETALGIKKYQVSTDTISANWMKWIREDFSSKDYDTGAFTDLGYSYAVGERGQTEDSIVSWTVVGSFETERSVTGLPLINGKSYTFSIRTTSCAGTTTSLTTPGVTVDIMPPVNGFVTVGNSTTHTTQVFRSEHLQTQWGGFVDYISGVARFEWAMGTTKIIPSLSTCAGLIVCWTDVGLNQVVKASRIQELPNQASLTVGTTFYIYVKAIDAVGNLMGRVSNATTIIGQ